jgi:hypothetical protein
MAELPNSFHTHQSWGRTRSPKNILSTHRAGIDAAGTGKTVVVGTPLTCITENQRFLHVVQSANNNAAGGATPTLTITGLMYAAGDTTMALRSVHNQDPVLNANGETLIIDISGIDRVVFTVTGDADDSVTFFAACSTF